MITTLAYPVTHKRRALLTTCALLILATYVARDYVWLLVTVALATAAVTIAFNYNAVDRVWRVLRACGLRWEPDE